MALSGLDIYKLLPKTNCRECGFTTCLAFAMQLAKKTASAEKCPYLSKESKEALEAASRPPIKLIRLGREEEKLEIGNETVMFRHEEKFYHPTGIGFIIDDSLTDPEIKGRIEKINKLEFERVGQKIKVDLIAIRQKGDTRRFTEVVKLVGQNTKLALALMSEEPKTLEAALEIVGQRKPLVYHATKENLKPVALLAKNYGAPLVVCGENIEKTSELTSELISLGIDELVLETKAKSISDKIWDLTQTRRLALKKNNRSLGYPSIVVIDNEDPFEEAQEAASYIVKYAGIVLIKGI